MTPARTASLGLLIAALAAAPHGVGASAEPVHKVKRGTPSRTARTAPDVTGTVAKAAPAGPVDPALQNAEIPPPVTLPTASRARVRACGETWRTMKLAGTTGDDDWRDFAFKCFAGKGPNAPAD